MLRVIDGHYAALLLIVISFASLVVPGMPGFRFAQHLPSASLMVIGHSIANRPSSIVIRKFYIELVRNAKIVNCIVVCLRRHSILSRY